MTNKIKSVAVYCGHEFGNNPEYARDARKIGELLARNKITMVFGGGDVGLMGTTAESALENGGEVIGISTQHVMSKNEPLHEGINVKVVDGLSTRRQEMFELSDAFIILPGGMGTLDEMTDILTKQQIGESCKPIFIMNTAKYWEFFGKLIVYMDQEGFVENMSDYNIIVANTPTELIEKLLDSDNLVTSCKAL
jgi:hypothetical protein